MKKIIYLLLICSFIFSGCRKGCADPEAVNDHPNNKRDDGSCLYRPNITTLNVSNITDSSALLSGLIEFEDQNKNYAFINSVGFHWNNGPIDINSINNYSYDIPYNQVDTFYYSLTGLSQNTTYHIQAFMNGVIDTNVNYQTANLNLSDIRGDEVVFTTN